MTTCNSQTEREKRKDRWWAALVRARWLKHVFPQQFHWTSQMRRVRAVNVRIEWSNLSQSSRAVAACAQSPVLQSPKCQFRLFRKNSFSVYARRRSQPRVGWILTADSNVLHASGYITTKRFYTRHDLETVITPENIRKAFKWVLRGLNEVGKVKQESMPMARWRIFRYKRRSSKVSFELSLHNVGGPRRRNPFRMLLIK